MRACQLAQFSRAAWYRRSHAKDQSGAAAADSRARARAAAIRVSAHLGAAAPGGMAGEHEARASAVSPGRPAIAACACGGASTSPCIAGRRRSPPAPTERWSMDFVHDALADGRPFRVLTVVDQWSRQSPILEVAPSMSGATVGDALDRVLPAAPALRSITRRSRHRVHVTRARGLGVSPRRPARFHPAGQTRGKCLHRVVQRASARRVLERPPVHVDRRCAGQDRSVAASITISTVPTARSGTSPPTSTRANGRHNRSFDAAIFY